MTDRARKITLLPDNMLQVVLPREQAHGLVVALEECPCKATKSTATAQIRKDFKRGLLLALSMKGHHTIEG